MATSHTFDQGKVQLKESIEISSLPDDIFIAILGLEELSPRDSRNFATALCGIRDIRGIDYIWKKKFLKSYPNVEINPDGTMTWYEELDYMCQLEERTIRLLQNMMEEGCCYIDVSDRQLLEWTNLVKERSCTCNRVMDILRRIYNPANYSKDYAATESREEDGLRPYALRVMRYLVKDYLKPELRKYLRSCSNSPVEKGAVLLSRWLCPEDLVTDKSVSSQLDEVADAVKEELKKHHPNHSIFAKSSEELDRWKTEPLICNQYGVKECRQMMESFEFVTKKIFAVKEKFFKCKPVYIHQALDKKVAPRCLTSIIHESVARRLGILFTYNFTEDPFYLVHNEKFPPKGSNHNDGKNNIMVIRGLIDDIKKCQRVHRRSNKIIRHVHNTELVKIFQNELEVAIEDDLLRLRFAHQEPGPSRERFSLFSMLERLSFSTKESNVEEERVMICSLHEEQTVFSDSDGPDIEYITGWS